MNLPRFSIQNKHLKTQDCAEFSSACKARKGAHSQLCNGLRNAEGGQKG